jgi:mannosyltransferase
LPASEIIPGVGIGTEPHLGSNAARDEPPAQAAAPPAHRRASTPVAIVLALTVLAAVLRFATLDVQSIWLDESATIVLVQRGFSGMLSHLSASESAPPLYYILIWAWTKVFGAGAVGFRSLSALAGTLTVPVLYAAGRRISTRAGLWAAALAAVNPAMYYYSQEARAYALLILLAAAALVLWQRALDAPTPRRLWAWAGMSILALLTHYFAAFLFLPEALILARRLGWRRVLAPIGAVVLVGLALLPLAAAQRADGKTDWIEAASLSSRVAESAKQFLVGLYGPLELFTAAITGLLALGAVALLLTRGQRHERRGALEVAIVFAVAIALPLLLAVAHLLDVYDGRNMIAAWAPGAVLVAAGLGVASRSGVAARTGIPPGREGRRAPWVGTLLGVGLCAVSLAVIVWIDLAPAYQRDNWRGAAQALPAAHAPRVVVSEENASIPLSIYLPGLRSASGTSVVTREIDFIALRTRRTGRAPLAPVVPTTPPPGFRLTELRRTASYALARFLAPRPRTVADATLIRLSGEPTAEVITQG